MEVGHIEIGTCWIPGPEGNRLLPDFLAAHVTNMKLQVTMNYLMEQEVCCIYIYICCPTS